MKRWIHSKTDVGVERIAIDFYGWFPDDPVEVSSSSSRRPFKNVNRVIADITAHLTSRGLQVIKTAVSKNHSSGESDSTYYDVDIHYKKPDSDIKYLYFRITDHPESALNSQARANYHQLKTAENEGLLKLDKRTHQPVGKTPEQVKQVLEQVKNMYHYHSIEVMGKAYSNYDKAINRAKQLIDEKLRLEGLLDD